jgi:hypothetical protein
VFTPIGGQLGKNRVKTSKISVTVIKVYRQAAKDASRFIATGARRAVQGDEATRKSKES